MLWISYRSQLGSGFWGKLSSEKEAELFDIRLQNVGMDKLYINKWELGIYVTKRNIHNISKTHYKNSLQFKSHFCINCI